MNDHVIIAIIGVVAALLGSAIGAAASYLSTRSMRRLEWRLSQIDKEFEKRESLYADFLTVANHCLVSALTGASMQQTEADNLLNLDNRIRLLSPELGNTAREIVSCVMDHYSKGKEKKTSYSDLVEKFIVQCRQSLTALRANV